MLNSETWAGKGKKKKNQRKGLHLANDLPSLQLLRGKENLNLRESKLFTPVSKHHDRCHNK
jgi:hypothetical protein